MTAHHCRHCGEVVSAEFVRVFGVEGEVFRCVNCVNLWGGDWRYRYHPKNVPRTNTQ